MNEHPVLPSCRHVCTLAKYVRIVDEAIDRVVHSITDAELTRICSPSSFDTALHYVHHDTPAGQARTVQYLLVLDALNFCFWPEPNLEYEHLAKGLKVALVADPHALDAVNLTQMTGERIQQLFGWHRSVPLQDERARLLREVGAGLLLRYQGQAAELVRAAQGSAISLVRLATECFPGFRDHAIYDGRQVFLYKRAQIFVGDVYGAFGGQGLGAFSDIHEITTFADYRVPVVLRSMGILSYSEELDRQVSHQDVIPAGSEAEVEIRAATVCAVDKMRHSLQRRLPPGAPPPLAVTLDWFLWERGEANRSTDPPHHRTLTIYY